MSKNRVFGSVLIPLSHPSVARSGLTVLSPWDSRKPEDSIERSGTIGDSLSYIAQILHLRRRILFACAPIKGGSCASHLLASSFLGWSRLLAEENILDAKTRTVRIQVLRE